MWKPEMKCGWDFPEFEMVEKNWCVTVENKPEICKDCEFFQHCFLQRSSKILGLPMELSQDVMTQLVYLQRLQKDWADDEMIETFIQSMTVKKH